MNRGSRTANTIKNAKVALIFYAFNLILQFFSRKVFIVYLGNEVLGLNTTAMNLLQFLNLAELGIGGAVGYALYKPLAQGDHQQINEIVSVQGYLYRKIGLIVLAGAVLLMFFFPYFFAKVALPIWYAYATFGVLLLGALASYFFNYKQIVLTSDQKDYKLTLAMQSVKLIKIFLQILTISFFSYGYVWWLVLESIATVVTVFTINKTVNKEYPWLHTNLDSGKKLMKKYSEITIKTKQLFFHKIGSFALTQTSPLIIYAYTSMTLVARYGNYLLLVAGLTALVSALSNGLGAGIGNLVAEGNKINIMNLFEEIFALRFVIGTIICFLLYLLTPQFISLWVGPVNLLPESSLILILVILFIALVRLTVDNYINAYGLFKDIYAPVIEAILNIGLSILFGYYAGLNGVLSGVLISQALVIGIWKPYFLFTYGLHKSVLVYIKLFFKNSFFSIMGIVMTLSFTSIIKFNISSPFLLFVVNSVLYTVIITIIMVTIMLLGSKEIRRFTLKYISALK